jgi:hypothetical protein
VSESLGRSANQPSASKVKCAALMLAVAAAVNGCSGSDSELFKESGIDGGTEAGDARLDSKPGLDAGKDTGMDTGKDAGKDAADAAKHDANDAAEEESGVDAAEEPEASNCINELVVSKSSVGASDVAVKQGQKGVWMGCLDVQNMDCTAHNFNSTNIHDSSTNIYAVCPLELRDGFSDTAKLLAQDFAVDIGTHDFILDPDDITIPAHQTITLCLKGDVTNTLQPGESHQLEIASNGDVGSDTSVTGAPVKFNTWTYNP